MTRIEKQNGWYTDSATTGQYAVLLPGIRIETSAGIVPLPQGGNVLYLVAAMVDGRLCLAGQGGSDGQAWLWNRQQWRALCPSYGTSPCAFGPHGCYVSTPTNLNNVRAFDAFTGVPTVSITKSLGARGIAAITGTGLIPSEVLAIDAYYGQHGLAEYLDLGGLFIGQGASGGCWAAGYGQLEPGDVQFIRAHRDGDNLTVAMWKPVEKKAVVLWLTVQELSTLPQPVPVPIPVPPEPPSMALIAPNKIDVVQHVIHDHPEINPLDEAQRGKIIDYACAVLGGRPWGRKSRNAQGTDLNTDGLTFLRPDGLFEIYDAISGSTGQATWDGFGPFRQGENGYWVPALPVGPTPPPVDPPPTDPIPAQIAALSERMEAIRSGTEQALRQLENRLKAQEDKPAPVMTLPKLRVKGSTSRTFAHAHTIDLEVTQE